MGPSPLAFARAPLRVAHWRWSVVPTRDNGSVTVNTRICTELLDSGAGAACAGGAASGNEFMVQYALHYAGRKLGEKEATESLF